MRICIIGKFPPIQGGVSMRTYRTAHALAARGHEVHVVTNALEARAPFRMYMRDVDWESCAAEPGADSGCVRVHWTDPVDRSQHYIPMASPFVTKLVSLAVAAHDEAPFDVIMSYYMQPYGIAAHLAAEITGAPHVARMAGSDAGRLWHLAQFEPLYDHVLRSANTLIAVGEVAERARERGVDPARIRADFGFTLDAEQFSPDGPALDEGEIVRAAREDDAYADLVWGALPEGAACFGVYGKLGAKKGSFELLEAIARLKRSGREAGLLAMAHGRPHVETAFRDHAAELGIADRVLQIPFLPHWRVPEFLRRCLAVCCLEQNFPIHFHAPIVAREVMLSGACLVGSTEILRKLPAPDSVVDGFNCVAIDDVTDVAALTDRLARIVDDPAPAAALGARGRALIAGMQANTPFPGPVEAILDEAASGRRRATVADRRDAARLAPVADGYPLTGLAAAALGLDAPGDDLAAWAESVRAEVARRLDTGEPDLHPLARAIDIDLAVAEARRGDGAEGQPADPLFRLEIAGWALAEGELDAAAPTRAGGIAVVAFDFDVRGFIEAETAAGFPAEPGDGPSFLIVFRGGDDRNPVLVDDRTVRILALADGTRTAASIAGELAGDSTDDIRRATDWIEHLFQVGLIGLRSGDPGGEVRAAGDQPG